MASLEQRLQRLEDIEAIKQLKADYCDACDGGWSEERPGHDWNRLQHIFTEDGVWDGSPISGRAEGHEQLREMYKGLQESVRFASHNLVNPQIKVDGDHATAKWSLLAMIGLPFPGRDPVATWFLLYYDDIYVRTESGWKVKEMKLSYAMATSFEKGWVKERIMDFAAYAEAAA
jgi:hypothetical protein